MSQGYIIIGERGVGLLLPVARTPIIVSRSRVGFKEGRLDLEQEVGEMYQVALFMKTAKLVLTASSEAPLVTFQNGPQLVLERCLNSLVTFKTVEHFWQ